MNREVPVLAAFLAAAAAAKPCVDVSFAPKAEIPSACSAMTLSMLHDADRPWLYVANKEAGLKIYGIADPAAPTLAATVPVSALGDLEVMNVSQTGSFLYLALGNHFTNPQAGGMAVVDVSDPAHPTVHGRYVVPGSSSGAGIVVREGRYAYLGAMRSGLAVIDVSDPDSLVPASLFLPDRAYPIKAFKPELYNARGLEVRDGIVYLAFDAGGVRIVDCRDPKAPKETGRYANPLLYTPLDHPRAYNNVALDGTRLYVAADYCGMEVLDVADPAAIAQVGWWNPDRCPDDNWFTSPVHANEIRLDAQCKRAFLSTGKSDLYVLDVSDPSKPDSCAGFGGTGNGRGTWGVGLWRDQVYLSYICTLGIPFASDWTGVAVLGYSGSCPVALRPIPAARPTVFSPPWSDASGRLHPLPPANPGQQARFPLLPPLRRALPRPAAAP